MAEHDDNLKPARELMMLRLWGELGPTEQKKLAGILAADESLAREYQELERIQEQLNHKLATADQSLDSSGEQDRIVADVMREVGRRQVRQIIAPAPATRFEMKFQWWHPFAAAAGILIGLLSWWGLQTPYSGTGSNPITHGPGQNEVIVRSATVEESVALALEESMKPAPVETGEDRLQAAENIALALADRRQNVGISLWGNGD